MLGKSLSRARSTYVNFSSAQAAHNGTMRDDFAVFLLQIIPRVHTNGHAAISAHDQISPDKRRQVPVEDTVHIPELDLCAVVLGNPIRLQHVGPDLRSEVDVQL